MNLQYAIVNKDNLPQSPILGALYQTTMDSVYEYGINTVEGKGLFYKTNQCPEEIISVINTNLSKYNIPSLDEGICDLIRDYGTLVYYDAKDNVTRPLMWAPGSYPIEALNKLVINIVTLPDLSVPTEVTWDIHISKLIPAKFIRQGKLQTFVNHRKSLRLLNKKISIWNKSTDMLLEPIDIVMLWNFNVASAIRKIKSKRQDPK